jgi:hypothetical protein
LKPARKSNSAILILLLIISIGCSQKKLNEETAVKIYVEKIIVEEKYSAAPDSLQQYTNQIFSKYNTTPESYKEFMHSLEYDTERWNVFFKKADTYLLELKKNRVID